MKMQENTAIETVIDTETHCPHCRLTWYECWQEGCVRVYVDKYTLSPNLRASDSVKAKLVNMTEASGKVGQVGQHWIKSSSKEVDLGRRKARAVWFGLCGVVYDIVVMDTVWVTTSPDFSGEKVFTLEDHHLEGGPDPVGHVAISKFEISVEEGKLFVQEKLISPQGHGCFEREKIEVGPLEGIYPVKTGKSAELKTLDEVRQIKKSREAKFLREQAHFDRLIAGDLKPVSALEATNLIYRNMSEKIYFAEYLVSGTWEGYGEYISFYIMSVQDRVFLRRIEGAQDWGMSCGEDILWFALPEGQDLDSLKGHGFEKFEALIESLTPLPKK